MEKIIERLIELGWDYKEKESRTTERFDVMFHKFQGRILVCCTYKDGYFMCKSGECGKLPFATYGYLTFEELGLFKEFGEKYMGVSNDKKRKVEINKAQ